MKKIIFHLTTGLCGMDSHKVLEYDDDVTEAQLDQECWDLAVGNAEMYGYYPLEWYDSSDDEEDEEDEDQYIEVSGTWEVYDENEHSGLV